ncbi:MAG: rhomboid family intramembrane serine protease [Paracoccaceae bacterium]
MSARPSPPPALPHLHPVIWALLAFCLFPEILLLGADLGLWGSARWRPLAYQNGAFWAGLLHGWRPNYAAQPVVMFASYGWLHAGPGHLIGNLGVLVWLGPQVLARFGPLGFSALWGACLLGGAAGFGLLTSSPAPMVGASGALFGLAGAWLVEEVRRTHGLRARLLRGGLLLAALLALNAAAWALQGGHLAWETHLGGMTTGMVLAGLWRGRNADGRPDEGPPVPDQDT